MNTWIVLTAIASFIIVIVIHELGHALVAHWYGIPVKQVRIGIGPVLFGSPHLKVCLFPIAVTVGMEGPHDPVTWEIRHSLSSNMMVALAGPLMNLMVGLLVVPFLWIPNLRIELGVTIIQFILLSLASCVIGLVFSDGWMFMKYAVESYKVRYKKESYD